MIFNNCDECVDYYGCYFSVSDRCPKIEMVAEDLGVPGKPKDKSLFDNIPFGVYMSLKHMVERVGVK